jgi:hypothetical protein
VRRLVLLLPLRVRELSCRLFGHRWRDARMYQPEEVRAGRYCWVCMDAEAHVYYGCYPMPRP